MSEIPKTLRRQEGHKEWFSEVMTLFREYGDKRAELALLTGRAGHINCLTEDNYEAAYPLYSEVGYKIAHLRDLIGGTVNGK